MNFADSEVVASILQKEGYHLTDDSKKANLVLLNTCSIRDKAEQTVRKKLKTFNSQKKENKNLKVGLLGCMAERLKDKLLEEEKIVDLVVGPDSYKDLPNLLDEVEHNQKAVNVILSKSLKPVLCPTKGESEFIFFSILSQTGWIRSAASLGPCFLSKESLNLTNLFFKNVLRKVRPVSTRILEYPIW